ncbi:hypothetical protein IF1G_07077 [Cordyceps javanica]|uniref:Uncharacterized protein n=1 Tax=Cordyceps javanica TaxID=43265 RepID=A0A545UXM3_9HYPO|nr:hypothetical protein IF1G_07077 [Cordyceps javanica]
MTSRKHIGGVVPAIPQCCASCALLLPDQRQASGMAREMSVGKRGRPSRGGYALDCGRNCTWRSLRVPAKHNACGPPWLCDQWIGAWTDGRMVMARLHWAHSYRRRACMSLQHSGYPAPATRGTRGCEYAWARKDKVPPALQRKRMLMKEAKQQECLEGGVGPLPK